MSHRTVSIFAIVLLLLSRADGQSGDGRQFDVLSIHPSALTQTAGLHPIFQIDAEFVNLSNVPLDELIRMAFRLEGYQIHAPAWLTETRFDVRAKLPEGASRDDVPEMLQSMLAERFKLRSHRETRGRSGFLLSVAKGGPKLIPSETRAAEQDQEMASHSARDGHTVATGLKAETLSIKMQPNGSRVLDFERMKISALAELLSRFVDESVVDATGLRGEYHVTLEIPPRPSVASQSGGPPGESSSQTPAADFRTTSLFESVKRLGLELRSTKAAISFFVVDSILKAPVGN